MLTFPQIQVGNAISHEALTVFPLFAPAQDGVDYLLSDKAITDGTITVEEVNEATRRGDRPRADLPA